MNAAAHARMDSLEETGRLGAGLAALIRPGDVLLLYGPLGAGKTTLTQAIAAALDVSADQYVSSPSFSLLHEYKGSLPIFHMDFYRLEDVEDIENAGLLEYLQGRGVCIVEWPERLGAMLPESRLDIFIEPDTDGRSVALCGIGESWAERAGSLAASSSR